MLCILFINKELQDFTCYTRRHRAHRIRSLDFRGKLATMHVRKQVTTRVVTLRDMAEIAALSRSSIYATMAESGLPEPNRVGSCTVRRVEQAAVDFIASRPRGGSERPAA